MSITLEPSTYVSSADTVSAPEAYQSSQFRAVGRGALNAAKVFLRLVQERAANGPAEQSFIQASRQGSDVLTTGQTGRPIIE